MPVILRIKLGRVKGRRKKKKKKTRITFYPFSAN
jgi:hypothetical protein